MSTLDNTPICACGLPVDPNDEDCVEGAEGWICGNCIRYWDACDTQEAAAAWAGANDDGALDNAPEV